MKQFQSYLFFSYFCRNHFQMCAKKKKEVHSGVNEPIQPYGNEPLTFEKVWIMFQETDKKFKETERLLTEKFEETGRQFKETDKQLKRLSGLFTTQWGKLMEALILPSCLKLFKLRGIDIQRTYSNVKIQGKKLDAEFDIVLANGKEVVIVEVKTTMTPNYVDEFLEKMLNIRTYFPEFKEKIIYGAVAGIKYENASDKYAYKNGLFVLINSGENIIKIANKKQFEPKEF